MATPDKTVEELLYEALEARAEPAAYTAAALDAKADRLLGRYARMRAADAARKRLRHIAAALRIVVGAVPNSSRILADAVLGPEPWQFAADAAGAVRGAGEAARIDAVLPAGATASIIVDDLGDERRILATIRNFPAAAPPPLMLLVDDQSAEAAIEIAPDSAPGPAGTVTLRYEALVPPGEFSAYWGDPGASA
ncbi:MAG TPA: hypothetical protein VM689_09310 [Aliidongia sp.]|nr:hypothetical protein [Aliidongia sp.]